APAEPVEFSRRSPAARPPLRQRWPLGAERAVVAVTGIEPGLVGQPVEDLAFHVPDEGVEVLGVAPGVSDATGEQRVAGEQVWRTAGVLVEQRDGAGRVADEVNRLGGDRTDLDLVAGVDRVDVDVAIEGRSVGTVRHRTGARGAYHLGEGLPVVLVSVRGNYGGEPGVADQLQEPVRLVRRVDERLLSG